MLRHLEMQKYGSAETIVKLVDGMITDINAEEITIPGFDIGKGDTEASAVNDLIDRVNDVIHQLIALRSDLYVKNYVIEKRG